MKIWDLSQKEQEQFIQEGVGKLVTELEKKVNELSECDDKSRKLARVCSHRDRLQKELQNSKPLLIYALSQVQALEETCKGLKAAICLMEKERDGLYDILKCKSAALKDARQRLMTMP